MLALIVDQHKYVGSQHLGPERIAWISLRQGYGRDHL